jgi:NADH-quinone oxidoreductase subunit E
LSVGHTRIDALPKTEGEIMEDTLNNILSMYNRNQAEIIPILQKVQDTYGYLSEDSMRVIAKYVNVPESQVYGVATFYAQFRFTPRGEKHSMVCQGTACHVNGSPKILEEVESALGIKAGETTDDLEFSLETVACIGACSLAPAVMINGKVEAKLNSKKVRKLFKREKVHV